MSEAFDRVVAEVNRLWEATDRLDTKILQFVGIVSAGAFAGGAFLAQGIPLIRPLPPLSIAFLSVGLVSLLLFVGLALAVTIGAPFYVPIDPSELAKFPELLEQDEEFRRKVLGAISSAHENSRAILENKVKSFSKSLVALGVSVISFAVAGMILLSTSTTPPPVTRASPSAPIGSSNATALAPSSPGGPTMGAQRDSTAGIRQGSISVPDSTRSARKRTSP